LTGFPATFTEFAQGYQLQIENFYRVTSYTYRILTGIPATPKNFDRVTSYTYRIMTGIPATSTEF
jgi:hypothetical protein